MMEMLIDTGLKIDDVRSVLDHIGRRSGKCLDDLGVVRRFINQEANTRFYLDSNLNSSTQQQEDSVYAWLDTGLIDYQGDPILISLLRKAEGFTGHFVGTISELADSAREYFGISRRIADQKTSALQKKYSVKIQSRRTKYMTDEKEYLFDSINQHDGMSEMTGKLLAAGFAVVGGREEGDNTNNTSPVSGDKETVGTAIQDPGMTQEEEEMTIGLLWEKLEEMQEYMDELVTELQKVSSESEAKIRELQAKNAEYRRVIVQIRDYTGSTMEEGKASRIGGEDISGHELLGKHGKILVIGGQKLGMNVMHGIAKNMGFEKGDFDFVEYDKAKDFADHIRRDGRYSAVIIGSCPHKTAGSAGYSSTVEKLKSIDGMPFTTDARSKSGRLKVTKESFRKALYGVYEKLKLEHAC